MLTGLPLAVSAQSAAAGAAADDDCVSGDTVQTCFDRMLPGLKAASVRATQLLAEGQTAKVPTQAERENVAALTTIASGHLAMMNTGAQSLASGAAPSTTDFASDFIALLESSGLGEKKGDTLTFHWDFPIRADANKKTVKISAALTDPKLDPKVSAALTGTDLTNATGSLDQLDDVTYAASWAFMKRDPKLPLKAVAKMHGNLDRELTAIRSEAVARLGLLSAGRNAKGDGGSISAGEMKAGEMTALVQSVANEARFESERVAFAGIAGVTRLTAAAADEKQQLSGQITYHERAALIGAKEIGASLTYEVPTKKSATAALTSIENVSDMRLMAAKSAAAASDTSSPAPKFTFKGEYKQTQRRTIPAPFDVSIPAATLSTLNKPSTHTLSLSAVAGWKFNTILGQTDVSSPAAVPDRIAAVDFNGTFENDSSDPKKKNRLIATLTFTQQISDHLTIPITLRYASHEADLGDVNKRFSAHFGVSYKIPPANPAQKTAEMAKRLLGE